MNCCSCSCLRRLLNFSPKLKQAPITQSTNCRAASTPNGSGPAHPEPPRRTGERDRRGTQGNGAGPRSGRCPRGAPRIPHAARAPTVDHPGVHPSTGVALLNMGGACRHVAPGTGGRPNGHRGINRPGPPRLAARPGYPPAQTPGRPPSGARGPGVQPRGNPSAAP